MTKIELWGKDHWSLYAYLVYLTENKLRIQNNRLRCNNTKHPLVAHGHIDQSNGYSYGTRLKDGTVIDGHDDWDCWASEHYHHTYTTEAMRCIMNVAKSYNLNVTEPVFATQLHDGVECDTVTGKYVIRKPNLEIFQYINSTF